jgi:SAM-dependent methyltransferase
MFLKHLGTIIHNIRIPKHIRENFRTINQDKQIFLREIIKKEYFGNLAYSFDVNAEKYLETSEGKADVENHLINRLQGFRGTYIPWLCSIKDLRLTKILEIGSGTGCSTLALAEQGAIVTGVDIDEPSIRVAKHRANLYGVDYTLYKENAVDIDRFRNQPFDFIIFFASLEHMTIDERIEALKKAWSLLTSGGFLVVIESPNRLWFHDDHTALLPFYHWLPDQLAYYYSPMSPRVNFYRFSHDLDNKVPESFHRLGRGVSYHEFELSIGKNALADVVGDLDSFLLKRRINPVSAFRQMISKDRRYHKLLKEINPLIHSSYFFHDINLAIKK